MQAFYGDRFQVQCDAPFKMDNPIFDFYEAALDCFNKAVEMCLRWNHHDVRLYLVQLVLGDEITLLETHIR